jgi:hypothetical protein
MMNTWLFETCRSAFCWFFLHMYNTTHGSENVMFHWQVENVEALTERTHQNSYDVTYRELLLRVFYLIVLPNSWSEIIITCWEKVKLSDDVSEQMKPLLSTNLHAFGNSDVTKNRVVSQRRSLSLNSKMKSLAWFIGKRLTAVMLQEIKTGTELKNELNYAREIPFPCFILSHCRLLSWDA